MLMSGIVIGMMNDDSILRALCLEEKRQIMTSGEDILAGNCLSGRIVEFENEIRKNGPNTELHSLLFMAALQ